MERYLAETGATRANADRVAYRVIRIKLRIVRGKARALPSFAR